MCLTLDPSCKYSSSRVLYTEGVRLCVRPFYRWRGDLDTSAAELRLYLDAADQRDNEFASCVYVGGIENLDATTLAPLGAAAGGLKVHVSASDETRRQKRHLCLFTEEPLERGDEQIATLVNPARSGAILCGCNQALVAGWIGADIEAAHRRPRIENASG